jgi:hypothetical protein
VINDGLVPGIPERLWGDLAAGIAINATGIDEEIARRIF